MLEKITSEQKKRYNLPSPEDRLLLELNRLSEHDIAQIQSFHMQSIATALKKSPKTDSTLHKLLI
jgi:hypothetical protein